MILTLPEPGFLFYAALLLTGSALAVRTRKLTAQAGVAAFCVGLLIAAGGGACGLLMLAAFFSMATWATAHKKSLKARIDHMKAHPEKRRTGQVLANGGIAALAGLLAWMLPAFFPLFTLMLAAALSAAAADTLASELGMVYGRRSFDVLSLKRAEPGPDGVVSIEGLLLGISGSCVIGLIDFACYGRTGRLLIIVLAGTLGNIVDSLLGATLERAARLNNDAVNMLNTLSGALCAWALWTI